MMTGGRCPVHPDRGVPCIICGEPKAVMSDDGELIARLRDCCRWLTFERNKSCHERGEPLDRRCLECSAADVIERLTREKGEAERHLDLIAERLKSISSAPLYMVVQELVARADAAEQATREARKERDAAFDLLHEFLELRFYGYDMGGLYQRVREIFKGETIEQAADRATRAATTTTGETE